MKKSSV